MVCIDFHGFIGNFFLQNTVQQIVLFSEFHGIHTQHVLLIKVHELSGHLIKEKDLLLFVQTDDGILHLLNDGFDPQFFRLYFGQVAALPFVQFGGHYIKRRRQLRKLIRTFKLQSLFVIFSADLADRIGKFTEWIGHKARKVNNERKQDQEANRSGKDDIHCSPFNSLLGVGIFPYNSIHVQVVNHL
ncbi:hypothetical protein D3C87_1380460 [compost metagenome]